MSPSFRLDPSHYDGGASFFHVGLTLWGSRSVCFKLIGQDSPLEVEMSAGHIYAGCLCCAEHFVQHAENPGPLPTIPGLGKCEVVLLMRSTAFRASRASTASSGPNPKATFAKALEGVVKALQDYDWRLPTMSDCLAAEGELEN